MVYGLLLENVSTLIVNRYGQEAWNRIREHAGLQHHTFGLHTIYSDSLFQRIINSAVEVTGDDKKEILESTGALFVSFIGQFGYDKIIRVLGRHIRDFLNGLDNLHEFMRFTYPKLKAPSFHCSDETEHGIKLHYRSSRKGFLYYVAGQIKEVGKLVYDQEVEVEVLEQRESKDGFVAVMQLVFDNRAFISARRKTKRHSVISLSGETESLNIHMDVFYEVFPFHVVYDTMMTITSVGSSLDAVLPNLVGRKITEEFSLIRPFLEFSWESVRSHTNVVFELQSREAVSSMRRNGVIKNGLMMGCPLTNGVRGNHDNNHNIEKKNIESRIHLKGQMMHIEEWKAMAYLATPIISNLDTMCRIGLFINDLSMHDSSRDLVLAGTQQSAELKLALDQEVQKSAKLEESMRELDKEKLRTDALLYQMIPKSVADRLRKGEPALSTCETFSNVTILFSDVVGFTTICSLISPMQVVTMLNCMYTTFDKLSEKHNVYKVETIGDAYMVVSGIPERTKYHAEHVADMALNMLSAMPTLEDPAGLSEHLRIRIGIHTGTVVAGVVGLKMPRYCLFGDTVNTASRMESTGIAMAIHVSETTQKFLFKANYVLKQRGSMDIKGKGSMKTYWLVGHLDGADLDSGEESTAGSPDDDDLMLGSSFNSRVSMNPADLPADDHISAPDSEGMPVAYYAHVPHTNRDVQDGMRVRWEDVELKKSRAPEKSEQGKGGMKTYWLVGNLDGADLDSGEESTAGSPDDDDLMLGSSFNSRVSMNPADLPADDHISAPDSEGMPVAYYAHVPHTNRDVQDGMRVRWEDVELKKSRAPEKCEQVGKESKIVKEGKSALKKKDLQVSVEPPKSRGLVMTSVCSIL